MHSKLEPHILPSNRAVSAAGRLLDQSDHLAGLALGVEVRFDDAPGRIHQLLEGLRSSGQPGDGAHGVVGSLSSARILVSRRAPARGCLSGEC